MLIHAIVKALSHCCHQLLGAAHPPTTAARVACRHPAPPSAPFLAAKSLPDPFRVAHLIRLFFPTAILLGGCFWSLLSATGASCSQKVQACTGIGTARKRVGLGGARREEGAGSSARPAAEAQGVVLAV